jgi:hypothetical protein
VKKRYQSRFFSWYSFPGWHWSSEEEISIKKVSQQASKVIWLYLAFLNGWNLLNV